MSRTEKIGQYTRVVHKDGRVGLALTVTDTHVFVRWDNQSQSYVPIVLVSVQKKSGGRRG